MVDTDDTRRTTDDGRRTTDDGRRTTPRVWHKLPTGELKTLNLPQNNLDLIIACHPTHITSFQYFRKMNNVMYDKVWIPMFTRHYFNVLS